VVELSEFGQGDDVGRGDLAAQHVGKVIRFDCSQDLFLGAPTPCDVLNDRRAITVPNVDPKWKVRLRVHVGSPAIDMEPTPVNPTGEQKENSARMPVLAYDSGIRPSPYFIVHNETLCKIKEFSEGRMLCVALEFSF
jgi:hypothetical protein